MKKKEERILGAQESLFYAMNEASPMHFMMAAEIEGNSTEANWSTAVATIQKIHPMLSMSIGINGENLAYAKSSQPLGLEIVPLTPSFDLAKAMEEELEKGFRSDRGPLARVKLFYSAQKCVVIVAAHHSISDALSSVNLIDDLLGFLSGKELIEFPVQPSVDEFLGYDNQGLAAKINRQINPGVPLPHAFIKLRQPAKVEVFHFSEEETALLAESAKQQNTTVHGALQAATALSLKDLSLGMERPAYIMSPFSLRKEMNVGTDFGLFIDTKIVAVSTNGTEGFWNIARLASKDLADVHSLGFLKSSAEQLRGLIAYSNDLIQFIKDNFNFDVMLSNLGRLSFKYTGLGFKVKYVAGPFIISAFNQAQAIGAATYDGKLVLTHSSRYLVPGLLKLIAAKINTACLAESLQHN